MTEQAKAIKRTIREVITAEGDEANLDSVLEALDRKSPGTKFDRKLVALLLLEAIDEGPQGG